MRYILKLCQYSNRMKFCAIFEIEAEIVYSKKKSVKSGTVIFVERFPLKIDTLIYLTVQFFKIKTDIYIEENKS